jgi:hypothetical protein
MHRDSVVTTYTKRDIRAADLLAVILFGFGLLLVVLAVLKMFEAERTGSAVGTWLVAGVFLMLGLALNLKVRQLGRNKGAEPAHASERVSSDAQRSTAQTSEELSSTKPGSNTARRAAPWTIVALSIAAVAIWSFVWFGPTGIRQARWMAESRQVLPAVSDRLASDGRFAGLKTFVSTGCNVVVVGNVSSEEDLRELRSMMGGITFPHGIAYVVHVE